MTRLEQASTAIRTAQGVIADLVAAAGRDQEWDEVTRLSDVGRRLRNLEEAVAGNRPVDLPQATPNGTSPLGRAVNGASTVTGVSARKGIYPRFCRDGEVLVKVAWSKSRREEYEHKAPRKVLTGLVEAMLKAGSKGKRFAMEQLLPLPDPENPGAVLPDYQPYVCLAWLRQEGLVEQYGRSGYSIAKNGGLSLDAANCWERLQLR